MSREEPAQAPMLQRKPVTSVARIAQKLPITTTVPDMESLRRDFTSPLGQRAART